MWWIAFWVGGYQFTSARSKAVCVALSPFTNQSPADGQYFQTPFHKPQGGCPQYSFVQWPQDKDTYNLQPWSANLPAYWAAVGLVRRQRGERMADSFTGDFIKRNGQGKINKLSKFRVDSLNNSLGSGL